MFILATIVFWLLIFRVGATLMNLDRYHPLMKFLFGFTEVIVRPFRFGIFRRPAKVDPAVIPPLIILALIIMLILIFK
jgi:uncharacterized protein YggT (Ycf19 family)